MATTLPLSPVGRRYGAFPSTPDATDTPFGPALARNAAPKTLSVWRRLAGLFHSAPAAPVTLIAAAPAASKADLRPWAGPVKNQGDLGACTGFAYSGLMELLCRKFPEGLPKDTRDRFDPTKVVLSPLFTYWWNRRNDGKLEVQDGISPAGTELKYVNYDRGANMRSGMRTLRWQGVCLEKEDPYNPRNFRQKPNVDQCVEALLFRGGAYHRMQTLDDMKNCLREGFPFTMAIQVYDSFESAEVARTGRVPVPDPKREKCQGGHAVLCVGFDDKAQHFIVRNSWGDDWGDRGDFYLPYAFFPFISDMWMMHFGAAW
jgi:C1A family cysteine protease